MRGSHHTGRTNARGQAYNVNHNDRTFKQEKSVDYDRHIDASKSADNGYFVYMMDNPIKTYRIHPENVSLRDFELKFYEENFGAHLAQTNAKYVKNRHKERVRTIEDVYTNPRTCPQETILQVGKDGEYKDLEKFKKMVRKYCVAYNNSFSDNSMILDYSIHADETSMHAHVRRVFYVRDKDGNLELAQNKALEQMGYQLPNPGQKRSKYNNRLQTFTDDLRVFWYNMIEKYDKDVKIEREPKYASRRHIEKLDYQNLSASEKLAQTYMEKEQAVAELKAEEEKCQKLKADTALLEQSAESHKQMQVEILQNSTEYLRKRYDAKMDYLSKNVKIPGEDTSEWDNTDWESWCLEQKYGSLENAIKAIDQELQAQHDAMLKDVADLEQVSRFAKTVMDEEPELSHSIQRGKFKKTDTVVQNATPEQVKEVFELSANMSSYLEQQQRINLQIQRELERKEKDLEQRERQLAREKEQNTLDRRIEIAKAVSEANNEKNREIKGLKSKLSEYQTLERRYPDVRMSLEKARGAELMRQMEEVAGEVEHGRKRDYGFER